MKKSNILIIGLVFCVILGCVIRAGRHISKGPSPTILSAQIPLLSNGPIFDIFSSSHATYAVTEEGLYISLDKCASWKRILSYPKERFNPPAAVCSLIHPELIYCAHGNHLLISRNGGTMWTPLRTTDRPITALQLNKSDDRYLFMATEQHLYLTKDGGASWHAIEATAHLSGMSALLQFSQERWLAFSHSSIFSSDDQGLSWTRREVFSGGQPLSDSETEELIEEQGESFAFPRKGSLILDESTKNIYCASSKNIWMSQDKGQTWNAFPDAGLSHAGINQLFLFSENLTAATQKGLFRYMPAYLLWIPVKEGIPPGPIQSIASHPDGQGLLIGTERGLFEISPFRKKTVLPQFNSKKQRPSIREIQKAAVQYAEVMPEKIQKWRSGAVWRTFLPKFTLSLDRNRDNNVVSSTAGGKTSFTIGPDDRSLNLGFGFTWDLANFVWNPDQISIDTRSRLMVQLRQDILEEVTRLYFERERLQAEFEGNPTDDEILLTERTLRIEEVIAQMDALTGGWYSLHMK